MQYKCLFPSAKYKAYIVRSLSNAILCMYYSTNNFTCKHDSSYLQKRFFLYEVSCAANIGYTDARIFVSCFVLFFSRCWNRWTSFSNLAPPFLLIFFISLSAFIFLFPTGTAARFLCEFAPPVNKMTTRPGISILVNIFFFLPNLVTNKAQVTRRFKTP